MLCLLAVAGCTDDWGATCPTERWSAPAFGPVTFGDHGIYIADNGTAERLDPATGEVLWSVAAQAFDIGADASGAVTVRTAVGLEHFPPGATTPDWTAALTSNAGGLRVLPEGDVIVVVDSTVTRYAAGAATWTAELGGALEAALVAGDSLRFATVQGIAILDRATGARRGTAPATRDPVVAVAGGFASLDGTRIVLVDADGQPRGAAIAPGNGDYRYAAIGTSLDRTQIVVGYRDGQPGEPGRFGVILADGATGAIARTSEQATTGYSPGCFDVWNARALAAIPDGVITVSNPTSLVAW